MRKTQNSARGTAQKIPAFSSKDRVDHYVFGLGTIVAADERRTTIAFDESGTRKFVTSMVKLSRSETSAPTRRARPKKKVGRSG